MGKRHKSELIEFILEIAGADRLAAHDIPILVKAGLLRPLGKPGPNAVKYFATAVLAQLREDTHWLGRASDAVMRHWQTKNARREGADGRHASRVDATSIPARSL